MLKKYNRLKKSIIKILKKRKKEKKKTANVQHRGRIYNNNKKCD